VVHHLVGEVNHEALALVEDAEIAAGFGERGDLLGRGPTLRATRFAGAS
jgi:hypothetical protein